MKTKYFPLIALAVAAAPRAQAQSINQFPIEARVDVTMPDGRGGKVRVGSSKVAQDLNDCAAQTDTLGAQLTDNYRKPVFGVTLSCIDRRSGTRILTLTR